MVMIIDDDTIMAECVARVIRAKGKEAQIFSNIYAANAAMFEELPEMIFLDILLDGPDGFTFLNEMQSAEETRRIPVVIISSLEFPKLTAYGVIGTLNKAEMTPVEISEYLDGLEEE